MKFTRTKKLVFFNNKWWVGKTTIAYNTAVKFAEKWYKTVLVDLDAQCNLSRLALGEWFDKTLFSWVDANIFWVLKGITQWGSDIDFTIKPTAIDENLSILPWSLKLSKYENLLITAYNQAAAGESIWYFQTSAISRYLSKLGLEDDIDLFVIDISPNLWLLNRIVLLWSDYFIAPLMPDAFSLQGVENLWTTLEDWKKNWKNTWKALAWEIANEQVLSGEALFIWYVINSYNQYSQKPIKSHEERIAKIPSAIKAYVSEKHCKNGLVESSRKKSLINIKDFWELSADSHLTSKAIFNLIPWTDFQKVKWTVDNLELAKKQFEELYENIEEILLKY
jgi:cellulose biosynthesis protein BcsQ